MYKCNKCECGGFDNYNSLSRHMGLTHKMDTTEFFVEYNLGGIWPLCKCGCEQKVKWSANLKGFRDYSQGHQSRVKNNWGHNQKAIDASSETRRKQYESGERKVWNVGLSTETDDRVKGYGNQISNSFNVDKRKKYSRMMKQLRDDKKIVPLCGPQHPNWNGGTSSISALSNSNTKLYLEWKRPILVRDGFKCLECGSGKLLHVHHDKETMSEIIKKHMVENLDINDLNAKSKILDSVIDYHINNNVSGITLCSKCHKNKHPSLNFT